MKEIIFSFTLLLLIACNTKADDKSIHTENHKTKDSIDMKQATFEDLFVEIKPQEIESNVFKLLEEDWNVVTAGSDSTYNSMIASWGGFGIIFEKPAAWLFLNANRFTLEKIKEYNTYTLCYMDTTYKNQKMLLGTKSGRDTDKMKENSLNAVKTPSGNIAYKESFMIIELNLESLMELNPQNFKDEKDRQLLIDGKNEGNGKEYHNMVTGIITKVWIKK